MFEIFGYWGDVAAGVAAGPGEHSPRRRMGRLEVVQLVGVLSRGGDFRGTSSNRLAAEIYQAAESPDVGEIVLYVNSPGGTVAGTGELADAVAYASRKKPLTAFVQDVGASAAYWVASQAPRIVASPTAIVGSIGTYVVVRDISRLANAIGIETHVVRAGAFKGLGTPGTAITADQLAEIQRNVNAINAVMLAGIARGRHMVPERVTNLADGRTHVGVEAKTVGLVDAVASWPAFLSLKKNANQEAPSEFAKAKAEEHARTDGPNRPGYWQRLNQQARDATAQREAADQAAATARATTPPPKAPPVDPVAQWEAEIDKRTKSGISRPVAIVEAARDLPELHASYLTEFNQRRRAELGKRRDDVHRN